AAGFKDPTVGLQALFAGSVGAAVPLVGAFLVRNYKLRRVFDIIPKEPQDAAVALIRYPFFEAKLILVRWVIGMACGHLFFIVLHKVEPMVLLTVPFVLLQVLPISFIVHLFITEDTIRPILVYPPLSGILSLPEKELPRLGYFARILMSICAVAVLPLNLLGYLLFASINGQIKVEHPLVHIVILGVQVIAAMIVTSYVTARAMKNGLSLTNSVLQRVGEGEFEINSVRTSADELGDQSYMLSHVIRQLNGMYTEINDLNETLEERVRHRTEELNKTLERVNELRVQQDGDYFLTSLLMKPLGANKSVSSAVTLNFLVHQKKKFEFRRWKEEIGGDLCIAHTLFLDHTRPHTVFINADAMGKSIQGAGGAIVLGAVFSSIVERTLLSVESRDMTPERWLKNAFLDRQKGFMGFDGTMLMSLFMGLVDDETGTLYYINAEHPSAVIYRNGKASFLPDQPMFYKLGTSGLENSIYVNTFRLQPEDVILAASDGRDEIVPSHGSRLPGRDFNETDFLGVVEQAGGMLDMIDVIAGEQGELSDDFSVVRAAFLEDRTLPEGPGPDVKKLVAQAAEAYRSGARDEARRILEEAAVKSPFPMVLTPLARILARSGDFPKASEYAARSLERDPSDTKLMFLASFAMKKCRRLEEGARMGERVRVRMPRFVRNLVNLCELHILSGNMKRAEELITDIFTIDADNVRAAALRDRFFAGRNAKQP
ncbi:MAG: SpoIIE family protein phosphatase, partial [Spirochaetia bacterium]|nr:SpoIIE family protein phosphatase [Spirochaetia bacterium]